MSSRQTFFVNFHVPLDCFSTLRIQCSPIISSFLGIALLLISSYASAGAHEISDDIARVGVSNNIAQPVDESIATCEGYVRSLEPSIQVQTVEENPNCATRLVEQMLVEPAIYLEAFYRLIESPIASDALWWAVFQQVRADEFRFSEPIVADMHQNLGDAISRCTEGASCEQWRTFIIPALDFGELYRCPELNTDDAAKLLAAVSYGDYYCVESTAQILTQSVRFQDIKQLFEIARNSEIPWSRRNAIRVLGRMLEQPGSDVTDILVSKILSGQIAELMLDRLLHDSSEDVLLDAIWILDTFFHPAFETQLALSRLSQNEQVSPELRFRSMASITRLIQSKERLGTKDMVFLEKSLESTDPWVRGYAAFATLSIQELPIRPYQERRIVAALEEAYSAESEFSTKAAIAQAIDGFQGSELLTELRFGFEQAKLAQNLSDGNIKVRSGLSLDEIPPRVYRMQEVEQAFFDKFGQAINNPTPESTNDSIELLLFANEVDYQEYMDAFVGYGSDAGGLYLESNSTLYTYERDPNESRFTVEHLIQHEYTHYLTGRYVFPGLWSDPGYHEEPKGWIDEGVAEYFAELELDENGVYISTAPTGRLLDICDNTSNQSLSTLIAQRAGYDEPGTFSYDLAWSFVKYLIENHPASINNLLRSFREDSYQLDQAATLLGFESVESIEADWLNSLRTQCAELILNAGGPTGDIALDQLQESGPSGTTGPKRYDEPNLFHAETLYHEIIAVESSSQSDTIFGRRQLGAPPPPQIDDSEPERFIRLIEKK